MRQFKISTNPGTFTVNRCREDFRWLVHNLSSEFPNTAIDDVHHGTLSKKTIENFFDGILPKISAEESRTLRFFLTAGDDSFISRRTHVSEYNFGANFRILIGLNNSSQILRVKIVLRSSWRRILKTPKRLKLGLLYQMLLLRGLKPRTPIRTLKSLTIWKIRPPPKGPLKSWRRGQTSISRYSSTKSRRV